MDGWVRWLEGLRGNYERRMQTMCRILDDGKRLVKSGRRQSISEEWSVVETVPMFEFVWPQSGMFVWVKMNFASHPLWRKMEAAKLARALWVFLTTRPFLVLVSPGTIFSPTREILEGKGWEFFRICFAAVDEPEVERTSVRFVQGVRAFWGKKRVEDVEEWVGVGERMGELMI